jgi:hypothetical protein
MPLARLKIASWTAACPTDQQQIPSWAGRIWAGPTHRHGRGPWICGRSASRSGRASPALPALASLQLGTRGNARLRLCRRSGGGRCGLLPPVVQRVPARCRLLPAVGPHPIGDRRAAMDGFHDEVSPCACAGRTDTRHGAMTKRRSIAADQGARCFRQVFPAMASGR